MFDDYAALARAVADKQLSVDRTLAEIQSLEERKAHLEDKPQRGGTADQVAKCQDKLRHLRSELLDQRHAVRLAEIKRDTLLLKIKYGSESPN